MDPLSITAGAIAIIQLCAQVVEFISAAAGATDARKRLGDEVRSCEFILQQLKDEVSDSNNAESWAETLRALDAQDGPLGRLWAALSALKVCLEPKKGFQKALQAIKWPFDEKEVARIISAMEREKLTLEIALTNNCRYAPLLTPENSIMPVLNSGRKLNVQMKKTLSENSSQLGELLQSLEKSTDQNLRHLTRFEDTLASIQASSVEISQGVDRLTQSQDQQQRMAILNWLTPIDYAPQHTDYINRRQAGTGQWLLVSAEFLDWVEAEKRTLFCPGIPGTGKTIQTAIVIDHLQKRFEDDEGVAIAYLYCNFRRHYEQKLEDLLLNLLKQLTQNRRTLPDSVKHLYHNHQKKRTRLSLSEMSSALQSVASLYSKVFIIVDALDECQTLNDCCSRFLDELFRLQVTSGVNIFATSRFIPEIAEAFRDGVQLEIRAAEGDIRAFLAQHMSPRRAFLRKNQSLQDDIKTAIVTNVHGMFLLARLHLDSLMSKTTEDDIRYALESLPTGSAVYDQAYKDAMERIESQDEDGERLAKRVLSWIVYARRPITTAEIRHALAVRNGDLELRKTRQSDIEDMISVCAGLVTTDTRSNIIRLVHYTTQQYFQRSRQIWFPTAEAEMTNVCLTYLSFIDFKVGACQTDAHLEERLRLHQLYAYSAHHWGDHASEASGSVEEGVVDFFKDQTNVESAVQVLLVARYPPMSPGYSQRFPTKMTGLHLAAYFGILGCMDKLMGKGANLNPQDSWGRTPLAWASANGHVAVVERLLGRGADTTIGDSMGRTPLSRAAANGHEAVVKALLEKESNVELKDRAGRTSLLWATLLGRHNIVKLLIGNNADVESTDRRGISPLSWAARVGNQLIAMILLDKGADIELKDDYGQTPLSWAARKGHVAIAHMLLGKGANPDAKDGQYGRTPLSWATWSGQEAIVAMLLKNGADIEARDSWDDRTSLSWAGWSGNVAVMEILLRNEAEMETKDDYGWTATSWAATNGHVAALRLLADNGANIESKDNRGQTPLSRAASNGRGAVIELLLGLGVDVESRDYYGQTPLSWAAACGFETTVRLLLQHGADINAKDAGGQTPLSWAAQNGQLDVAQSLLAEGAEMEVVDERGCSPLLWAARNNHEGIVKFLLKRGVNASTQERVEAWRQSHKLNGRF